MDDEPDRRDRTTICGRTTAMIRGGRAARGDPHQRNRSSWRRCGSRRSGSGSRPAVGGSHVSVGDQEPQSSGAGVGVSSGPGCGDTRGRRPSLRDLTLSARGAKAEGPTWRRSSIYFLVAARASMWSRQSRYQDSERKRCTAPRSEVIRATRTADVWPNGGDDTVSRRAAALARSR